MRKLWESILYPNLSVKYLRCLLRGIIQRVQLHALVDRITQQQCPKSLTGFFGTFLNKFKDMLIETDKEMYRRELLNQPMRVQIAGPPLTVIISKSE